MKLDYPFSTLIISPTVEPSLASILVVAASKHVIDACCAEKSDFTQEYSKELYIVVPLDYKSNGCQVYGGKWIDTKSLNEKDKHFFYGKDNRLLLTDHGLKFCVGTPESFHKMKNVILEAVKTADNMLVAYRKLQTGESSSLELKAYSHGDKGREEYMHDRKRYKP